MKNNFIIEILISLVLIALVFILLNPFGTLMPSMMVKMIVAVILVLFAVFAVFVWREKAGDEREQLHRMIAGRMAFLAGSAVMVAGIIVQALRHDIIDVWLVSALTAMVLVKLFGIIYSRNKH